MTIGPQAGQLDELAELVRSEVGRKRAPWFNPEDGEVVMLPDGSGSGYWVGAPGVVMDEAGDRVLMTYRRRCPRDGSARERGYLAAIAASCDGGRTFQDIWTVTKEEVATSSLERFCLRPSGEGWWLYTSWESPPGSGQWRVDVLQAAQPEQMSVAHASGLFLPGPLRVDAVKDPYVFVDQGTSYMYLSTFLSPAGPAPTSLAAGTGGKNFEWQGLVLDVGQGWDAHQARISSVMRYGPGYLAYYDGGRSAAEDTEERCGWAVSVDLRSWRKVNTHGPTLTSPHGTGSLRYVDLVQTAEGLYAYFEYARPDGSHELRRCALGQLPD